MKYFWCILVLLPVVLSQRFMSDGLLQLKRASTRQLEKSFTPLVQKALERKDDLALAELLGVLSRTPGVSSVRIKKEKLELEVSDYPRAKLLRKYLLRQIGLWGFLCAGAFLYMRRLERKRIQLESKLNKTNQRLEQEVCLREKAETSARACDERTQAMLQDVMALIDMPLIVLDAKQRVVAVSRSVGREFMHKSWLEIPALKEKGKEIETAIKTGGHEWVAIAVE